ncbi:MULTISPECIES: hypothetical protein [Weeksellaceae]|uniref:hypothetical protein n=1 Tax=Weeksellaceae TaxID=2762318 RepID=UPI00063D4B79|nr:MULTISPECIES: hypothetical protein [Weeksellaceae]
MEHINKNKKYIFLKIIIYSIGFLSLIFLSNLWIGTEENWDQIVKDEFIPALITRTIVLVVIGLVFLGISFGLDYVYKKKNNFTKELFFLLISSLILNLIRMLIL